MKNKRMAEQLAPLKDTLEKERAALLKQVEPLHARRQALLDKMAPLEGELREVNKQIKAIEVPRLRDVGNELAGIARACGAVTLTNEDSRANG